MIREFEAKIRATDLGPEEITRTVPEVGKEALVSLDEEGIIRIGTHIKPNDILVGKVTPSSETKLTPEERLLRVIFGEKAREVDNTSIYVPLGVSGTVVSVRKIEEGLELWNEKTMAERRGNRRITEIKRKNRKDIIALTCSFAARLKEILPERRKDIKPNLTVLFHLLTRKSEKQEILKKERYALIESIEEINEKARKEALQVIVNMDHSDVLRKVVIQVEVKEDETADPQKEREKTLKCHTLSDYRTSGLSSLSSEFMSLGFNTMDISNQTNTRMPKLVSSSYIKRQSYGEVKKPETINYRTFKAEKDGLFCEKIFGPVKDWECACGKFKQVKYRGIVCNRCGVEVTTSDVRQTRSGHIKLMAQVAYAWPLKDISRWLETLLDMSRNQLLEILYYRSYLVLNSGSSSYGIKDLITEKDFKEVKAKFPDLDAEIGGSAIKNLLQRIDLKKEYASLLNRTEKINANQEQHQLIIKKLKIVKWFIDTKTKPEWLITDVIPVIPPYLRPSIDPLGKDNFTATDLCYFRTQSKWFVVSGLNVFYEAIINRNNRLGRLIKLGAPDIIIRNQGRMLQESVDDLCTGIVNRNNFLKWFFKSYDPETWGLSAKSTSIITKLPPSYALGGDFGWSHNIYLNSLHAGYKFLYP